MNTGAAVLLGAAADPGPDGQAIDAVALLEPFDDLPSLVKQFAADHVLPLPGWVAVHLAIPVAVGQLAAAFWKLVAAMRPLVSGRGRCW